MKILDMSAGNRAIWFNKNYRDAIYIDTRPEVKPTFIADARALPAILSGPYDLIVFDPPHKNNGAVSGMTRSYGHWNAEQIKDIIIGTAKEAYRVTTNDGLMAFKWNDHTQKLTSVLEWFSLWWEPLFGHGVTHQQKGTSWVMLRRRTYPWELVTR